MVVVEVMPAVAIFLSQCTRAVAPGVYLYPRRLVHIHTDIVHRVKLDIHNLPVPSAAANKEPREVNSRTIAEEYGPHHKDVLVRTGRRIASRSSSNDTMK